MATFGQPIVASPNMLPSTANVFSASTAYSAGDYVWYNGKLYCFTADHAAGAWTGSDASEAKLADDVSNLKSAVDTFCLFESGLDESAFENGTLIASTGLGQASTTRIRTKSSLSNNVIRVVPKTGFKVSLYAWAGAEYIGVWNGTSFVKVASPDNFTEDGWDLKKLPGFYQYRVLLAKTDDSAIDPSAFSGLILTLDAIDSLGDSIVFQYDESSAGKYIAADGTIGDAAMFHYTLPINVKYGETYEYSFVLNSQSQITSRIHGYDTNGNWVKQVAFVAQTRTSKRMRFGVDDVNIATIRISNTREAGREALYPIVDVAASLSNIKDVVDAFAGDELQVPISWDAASNGKYIGADGTIGEFSGFHYSDLLPVVGGTYELSYLKYDADGTRIRVHGYDSEGNWLANLFDASEVRGFFSHSFDIDGQISYVRLSFSQNMSDIIFARSASAIGALSGLQAELNLVKYGMPIGSVDLTTANAVCKCVQSYLDHNANFVYGQNGTATKWSENGFVDPDTGKFRIDCSTLALLVLMGVDYDHSLYNQENVQNRIQAMGYGFNPFWGKEFPWDAHDLYGTYTWQMCYEYAKMGCTIDIVNRDFSGVQPGDLLFWGSTSNASTVGRYRRIRHVDVVLGRVDEKDALVADAGDWPITIHLASERTANDNVAVIARLPLGVSSANTLDVISETYEEPITDKAYSLIAFPARYTPVAAKIRVTQTESTGSVTLKDSANTVILASEEFNAGTEGKTFDVVCRGFIQSANVNAINLTAVGATVSAITINYPATCVESV